VAPEHPCDHKEPINFVDVDYLYGEVPTQYTKLIDLLTNEFTSYKVNMMKTLKEEDFDLFSQIRHSMRSNMRLLHMHQMEKLLDAVRNDFVNHSLPPGGGAYVEKIGAAFDVILLALEDKLKILTT
jgi:hypothetical protein